MVKTECRKCLKKFEVTDLTEMAEGFLCQPCFDLEAGPNPNTPKPGTPEKLHWSIVAGGAHPGHWVLMMKEDDAAEVNRRFNEYPSLSARLEGVEKENAKLREALEKCQSSLVAIREDMEAPKKDPAWVIRECNSALYELRAAINDKKGA